MSDKPFLYFDYAATTPLHPGALEAMMPYLTKEFGNPSAVYSFARTAKKAIERAREQVASVLGARPDEIIFTGGGTEANNWALKGVAEMCGVRCAKGRHIITTAIEHHAVTHVCDFLKQSGYEITFLPVDSEGFISPDALAAAIRPDTILISVMLANNEIGTLQPMARISAIAKERGILLHTDAVQAVGHVPIDARDYDLLTMSAHKFYGPKGMGALYVRKGTKISPYLHGGAQERNRRAGTENVAGIVGMGEALVLTAAEMESELTRLTALRDTLIRRIETEIPHARLNGPRENRLPGNVNFSFAFIEGESLLLLLDMQGVSASSGSACSSASLEPSHVLLATGVKHEEAHGSIRFSMGRGTTEGDIDALMEILPKHVARLREMSPLVK
jgi:cysteine desulfurase